MMLTKKKYFPFIGQFQILLQQQIICSKNKKPLLYFIEQYLNGVNKLNLSSDNCFF